MLVIERSLQSATFTIYNIVSLFLLYYINHHLMLPGLDVSYYSISNLADCSWWSVSKRRGVGSGEVVFIFGYVTVHELQFYTFVHITT
jgi:hypothetical protein